MAKQIFDDNRRDYGDGLKKFEPNDLNNALMLDLSRLQEEKKQSILNLYFKYRMTVLDNNEESSLVNEINDIFVNEYAI